MGAWSAIPDFDRDEFQASLFRLQSMKELKEFTQPDGGTSFRQMSPIGRFTSRRAQEVIHDPANKMDKETFVSQIQIRFGLSRNQAVGWYYRYRSLIRLYHPSGWY